jgi:hypothetical protein
VRRAGAGGIRRTLAQPQNEPAAVALYGIAVATFDDDPGVRADAHAFIVDKAPWFTVSKRQRLGNRRSIFGWGISRRFAVIYRLGRC